MSDRRPYGRQEREEYGGRGASDYDERHGFNRSNGPREQRLSFATPMSMNDPEAAFNSRNGYSTGERSQRKTTPNSLTQSSGGPVRKTPNSLVQSTGGPTSRAERKGDMYGQSSRQKTPDSLMDSIGPTSRADIKEEPYYSGRGNDLRTAQQRSRSIDRFDARSGSSSQGRHTKSYVERYQDIKQMTLNGGDEYETHRKSHQQRSKSADRWSASARDDPLGRSGAPRGSRPGSGIRAASSALASRNYRNHNYASSSQRGAEDIERTPLERWESRKERKQAESSLSRESPPYSARTDQTATPSSRDATLASDMSIRANRWSPQSNSDEYGRNERGYSPEHRPKPARNRDPYGRQGYGESGDSSPLFNDVDEEGAGNINVGQRSPLSINNRFDRNYDDDVASTTRSVMSGNSTYADNLKSFSESITGPLAEGKSIRRENYEPSHQHHESREPHSHDRSGDRGGMPTDSFERNTPNHHDLNDEDASYQEKRVRWGASDFCKRFTENRKDQPRSSSSSQNWGVWKPPQEHDTAYDHGNPVRQSLDKSKKMYMWLALTVCAVCIVAVAATVTYFQGESNRENSVAASTITPPPTMSSMPSEAPTMTPSSSPSNNPTPRPSTERERLIGEFLHSVSEGESSKVGTPQYEAKMWLLFDDDLFLHLPGHDTASWESNIAERIKQRFALATMYFAMGIGEGGVSKGWLDGDECRNVGDYGRAWDGVACNGDGVVRAVALDGTNLKGHIPPQISLLKHVENLIVKNNPDLRGTIPAAIGQMSQLRQLGLYENDLTGTVPKSISDLSNLIYLNLADNTLMGEIDWEGISHLRMLTRLVLHNNFFEGSIEFHLLAKASISLLGLSNNLFGGYIDGAVGTMSSLEYLYLDRNKLIGQLPSDIGYLSELKAMNLDENEIDGTLPHTLGNLSNLAYLSARGNRFSGGFPASIKFLTNLKTLNLASNALSGHIRHLTDMTSLENVHLYQNSFTGTIPASIFSLPDLEVMFLSSNHFTGTIPGGIINAQKALKGLYLSDNNMQGIIPSQLCSLYKLEDVFLDTNEFSGTMPSCMNKLTRLKRLLVFKNRLTGQIPSGLSSLANLVQLGVEENSFTGGITNETCAELGSNLKLWADCSELDNGCDCCTRCCSDASIDC